jgi:membrane-bound metal-dependent hydrolase YbcI (DUF457 family)
MLLVVGASYLPDIATQSLSVVPFEGSRLLAHSIWFAGSAGLMAGLLAPFLGVPRRVLAGTVFLCIVLHDLMDVVQATDRMPFWPVSTWVPPFTLELLPSTLSGETLMWSPVSSPLAPIDGHGCHWRALRPSWSSLQPHTFFATVVSAPSNPRGS